jgi:hypothetical protein
MNESISNENFFSFSWEEYKEIEKRVLDSDIIWYSTDNRPYSRFPLRHKDILKYSIDGKDQVTIKDYIKGN